MPCCGELRLDHEENAETGKSQATETGDRNLIQRSRVSPKVRLAVHCGLKSDIARRPRRGQLRTSSPRAYLTILFPTWVGADYYRARNGIGFSRQIAHPVAGLCPQIETSSLKRSAVAPTPPLPSTPARLHSLGEYPI